MRNNLLRTDKKKKSPLMRILRTTHVNHFLPVAVTFSALLVIFLANTGLAWDTDFVHPRITQSAINYVKNTLGLQEIYDWGFFNIGTDPECSFIDEGSVKEDIAATSIESWINSVWVLAGLGKVPKLGLVVPS
jgi:hypothetical protein